MLGKVHTSKEKKMTAVRSSLWEINSRLLFASDSCLLSLHKLEAICCLQSYLLLDWSSQQKRNGFCTVLQLYGSQVGVGVQYPLLLYIL